MNKKYLLLTAVALAFGIGILFMPARNSDKQLKPEMLLAAIDDPSRFLSTDDITDRLVKKDPALMLIDVRPAIQFHAFSVPGSINIPFDSLLSVSSQDMLSQKGRDKVFLSNSDVTSDQAWIICKRIGQQRIYVMQGGINKWFNAIVKAEKPAETASSQAMELYRFRMAACEHFFGSTETGTSLNDTTEKKTVNVVKKSSGAKTGGGC